MANARRPSSARPSQASPELQRLIDEQRVKPVTDLDKLSSLWPPEHDPDALLAFLHEERAARRATKRRRSPRA